MFGGLISNLYMFCVCSVAVNLATCSQVYPVELKFSNSTMLCMAICMLTHVCMLHTCVSTVFIPEKSR